ncbi:MAG: hypothetical protein ACI33P_02720 [Lysinibacillus sp.]
MEGHKEKIMQEVKKRIHEPTKKGLPFLLPIITTIAAAAIALFLFFTFQSSPTSSVETAGKPILYEKVIDGDQLTFEESNNGYYFSFQKKGEQNVWKTPTFTIPTAEEGMTWEMINIPGSNLVIGGVITDEAIKDVHVIQYTTEEAMERVQTEGAIDQLAEIIDMGSYRIWYVVFQEMIESDGDGDPLRIEGLNAEKEAIWRTGNYADGFESGYVQPVQNIKTENIEYELTLFKPDETVSFVEPYKILYTGSGAEEEIIRFIYEEVKQFDVELLGYEWKDKGKTLILDLGEGLEKIQGSTGGMMYAETITKSYFDLYPELQTIIFTHYHSFESKLDHFALGFPYSRE